MRLNPTELESRSVPSAPPAGDAGGGLFRLADGRQVPVFEDYHGLLIDVARADGSFVVAASPYEKETPGGPRVCVLNPDGSRAAPDFWAGDPDSRAGVWLVDAGAGTESRPPTGPATGLDLTDGTGGEPVPGSQYQGVRL